MIYEHALDLVDATTKCLKAAVAVRSAKGAGAIPHVESLVREARLAWGDACEAESQAWGEAHGASAKASALPQETLNLDTTASDSPVDPEAALAPPLEAQGLAFHETAAHADLPADSDGAPPLEIDGDPFEELPPPTSAEGTVGE